MGEKNTEYNILGDFVQGDKYEHHHETPHIIPKLLTSDTGLASEINLVGRKEELQKVDKLLKQGSAVLLNGIGGIGKSILASYYFNLKKDKFNYYAFVQVEEDIKSSFTSAFSYQALGLKSDKTDDLFSEIMNKLHNLDGIKLLLIDDIKDTVNQKDDIETIIRLENSGFKILFTSREDILRIHEKNKYFLEVMNEKDARSLFLEYFPTDEIDKVDKIVDNYLDYHTLFIEMTAKTLSIKERLSLDEIIDKFENREFSIVKRDDIDSYHKYLNNFSLNDIILKEEENLLFIKNLSLLPSIKISFEDLYVFLVCNDKDKLDEFLIKLVRYGWLIKLDNGYKLHQILKEYIVSEYQPTFEEIKETLNYINYLISFSGNKEYALQCSKYSAYLKSADSMLKILKVRNISLYSFYRNYGYICAALGDYKKALYLFKEGYEESTNNYQDIMLQSNIALMNYNLGDYQKALIFYQNIMPIIDNYSLIVDNNIAEICDNMAGIYEAIGKDSMVMELHNKALLIRKQLFHENHPSMARSYNNIALTYKRRKDYKNAELNYQLCLKILTKYYSSQNHPEIATTYNNMAQLYRAQGIKDKVLELHTKALEIRENIFGEFHPDVSQSYNNISLAYSEADDLTPALEFVKKAIDVREKLEINDSVTAIYYTNITIIYCKLCKWDKAFNYILKAMEIQEKVLPKEHPDLLESVKLLEFIGQTYNPLLNMGVYE